MARPPGCPLCLSCLRLRDAGGGLPVLRQSVRGARVKDRQCSLYWGPRPAEAVPTGWVSGGGVPAHSLLRAPTHVHGQPSTVSRPVLARREDGPTAFPDRQGVLPAALFHPTPVHPRAQPGPDVRIYDASTGKLIRKGAAGPGPPSSLQVHAEHSSFRCVQWARPVSGGGAGGRRACASFSVGLGCVELLPQLPRSASLCLLPRWVPDWNRQACGSARPQVPGTCSHSSVLPPHAVQLAPSRQWF